MRTDAADGVELRLLGPLELLCAGSPASLGGKPRALLARLALNLGEAVSVDRLVEDLWGEGAPESAAHAIQVYVSQVRKALGPARAALATRGPGYALELAPPAVDAQRFAGLVDEGRFGDALSLWRGPALADFAYEPFAQVEIARLEELRQRCIEGRIEADLAAGRHAELVAELEALVAGEPLRERLRALLMLALYRSGRQADALAAYRAARETLVEELGIEPGPELRELEAAILRQDESLAVVAASAEPAAPKRKLVTILFADVVESMSLAASLDPEAFHGLLQRYFETVRAIVARHGGVVEKFAGDAAMAVFGVPVAHEDDALRAARAASELQAAATRLDVEIRVGIETGEVLAGDASSGQRFVTGEAVGFAARAQQVAGPGAIVLGETAARLVAHAALLEPVAPIELRSREPLPAFRLVSVVEAAPAVERRLDAPLVGRKDELEALHAALASAVETGKAQGLLVVGPAGIGKSRLAEELAREADAFVLAGRCLSYGDGITYWPLRTMVAPEELEPILAAPSAGEIAWAFREHCERLAAERPLVLVLDDLHWAESTFLDLVEDVVDRCKGAIVALALAREELLEERPRFLAESRLSLEGLTPVDAETLLADRPLSDEARARIIATAEGNPLFLEQLAAFAAEHGMGAVPETIQALLASRLDRLGPGERAVLERAAVIGKEFGAGQVGSLLEPAAAGTVARHLQALTMRGFIRPGAEEEYRFRHGLIQDAVYRATPKAERAARHELFADTLDGDPEELDELVGYHLEQAWRLRSELGVDDRSLHQLAADAGKRLGDAGIRAAKRSDLPAMATLLGRATSLLTLDDALGRRLACELGVALDASGAAAEAVSVLEAAERAAVGHADRRVEVRARVELAYLRLLEEAGTGADDIISEARAALPVLESLADERAVGRAWLLAGYAQGGILGRHREWLKGAERALEHYSRGGWPTATCIGQIAAALYYGPTQVSEALSRCARLLGDARGGRTAEAHLRVFSGGLEAMRGRFDRAREEIAQGVVIYEELGQTAAAVVFGGAVRGDVELAAGDLEAAERVLTETCTLLVKAQNRHELSTRAADLAEALYRQERYADAERWTAIAAESAAKDNLSVQPLWRAVSAKILAVRGEHAPAESMARQALRFAEATEALNRRARVYLALAEVLHLAGQRDEADSCAASAANLYRDKGNIAGAKHAGELLAPR
jgi:DNA-binding SARP family transcriptional activator